MILRLMDVNTLRDDNDIDEMETNCLCCKSLQMIEVDVSAWYKWIANYLFE